MLRSFNPDTENYQQEFRKAAIELEREHHTFLGFMDVLKGLLTWLPGRQVLLAPHSLGPVDPAGKILRVNLTRKQIGVEN